MMIKQTILSTLLVGAASFAPLSTTPTSSRHADASVRLDAKHQPRVDLGLAKFFGLVATTSALSNGDVPAARATVKMDDSSCMSNVVCHAECCNNT